MKKLRMRVSKSAAIAGIVMGLATLGAGLYIAVTRAAAATSCRTTIIDNGAYAINYTKSANNPETYWYTKGRQIVPGNSISNCTGIKVSYLTSHDDPNNSCVNFRVRFYVLSGGKEIRQEATGWKKICTRGVATYIATNVINGTHYRVEAQNVVNHYIYEPLYRIYD